MTSISYALLSLGENLSGDNRKISPIYFTLLTDYVKYGIIIMLIRESCYPLLNIKKGWVIIMEKMYLLVLDVETAGDVEENPLVYDIGAQIIDLSGNVYERESWVVYDVYVGERELMKSAYYADKLPQYEIDLSNKVRKMAKFSTIKRIIWNWMFKYHAFFVPAYNASFDRRALNNTLRHLTQDEEKYFFPRKTEFIDIWRMACLSICATKDYHRAAYDNGWYSEAGNIRTNAETVYRYLINSPDFEEAHTGLEDVGIETFILLYCWNKVKADEREIVGNPWRLPQKEWFYHEAKFDGII